MQHSQFIIDVTKGGKRITVVPLSFGRARLCVAATDDPANGLTYDTGF